MEFQHHAEASKKPEVKVLSEMSAINCLKLERHMAEDSKFHIFRRFRQYSFRPIRIYLVAFGSTFLAFKKQITDRISQSAAPSIILNMFNAQKQT